MSTRSRKPVEEFDIFTCLLCEGGVDIPAVEYKRHREEVHGLTDHHGRRISTMHMDARDWFQWAFEWREPGDNGKVFAVQVVRQARRRGDAFREMAGK